MKRLLLMLAVLALVVAACGGTPAETTDDDAASSQVAQGDGAEKTDGDTNEDGTSAEPPTGSGDDGELTINDFIPGFDPTAFEETDWRSQELEVEQAVAECMAAEGFEYIPFVPADVGGGFIGDEWDQETYVKEYGFGVATWVLQEQAFQEDYDPEDDPWANNPNNEIVEAMDELEREEYYRVLHGSEPEIIMNTPWEEIEAMTPEEQQAFYDEAYRDWEPDGCYNEAWENAYDFNEGAAEAFYEEFGQDLDDIYQRVESDPRVVAIQDEWSACMADKGHDFADQEEMYGYFYGTDSGGQWQESEFQRQVNELITYPEVDDSYFENLDEGEEPDPTLWAPQYDIEALQPFINEEIAVATADFECSEGMWDKWEEIYKELEAQFIAENMDRLLAFRDSHS